MTTGVTTTPGSYHETAQYESSSSEFILAGDGQYLRVGDFYYTTRDARFTTVDERTFNTGFEGQARIQFDVMKKTGQSIGFPPYMMIVRSYETVTDDTLLKANVFSQFMSEQVDWPLQRNREYAARIELLRSYAEAEGIDVNQASESNFWSFVASAPFANKAGLVLMDNGNLRAVWKGQDSSHIGIQFLGRGRVSYVMFKRRPASEYVSRATGTDTLGEIMRQIHTFDLAQLVNV